VTKSVENTKSVLKTSISRTKDGKKSESDRPSCLQLKQLMEVLGVTELPSIPEAATSHYVYHENSWD
jgi:hypothetical protein